MLPTINKYYWSLDLSTTNVGMALWDSNGKLVELKHLQLKTDRKIPEEDRYIYKADMFKEYAYAYREHVADRYDGVITEVIIEKPLPNTKVNINTTSLLLGFNGIACYILHEIFGKPPILISVHEARKLFLPEFISKKGTLSFPKGWASKQKKFYIWQKVSELEPAVEWFYGKTIKGNRSIKDESFDMSDAYACGHSGLIKLGIIKKKKSK
jgi:hypothetical protein